jgi:hypothetical protein
MVDFESVDWESFGGPEWYRPSDVPNALRALTSVLTEDDAQSAYNRVLFAVGNNHAGTIYPAALGAVPFILEIALRGSGWSKRSAIEVLIELVSFEAEPGFESVRSDGRTESLSVLVRAAVRAHRGAFEGLAKSGEPAQRSAQVLLEALEDN